MNPIEGGGRHQGAPPPVDLVVAVDVGGTLTKLALVDAAGGLHGEHTVPTDRTQGPDGTVVALAAAMAETRAAAEADGHAVVGFGVVVPGIVDAAAGIVRAAANLDWHQLPLRDRLTEVLGLPGAVAHDVRSAGLAEWRLGPYAEVSDLLFLPLGTGIAAAMVVDGRLLDAGGYAGEIGHIAVPAAGGTPCACGQQGCLETVASAAGVARSYARLAAEPKPTHEVAVLARGGDPAARRAFDHAVDALTEALVVYVGLLAPQVIIIGGGLSGAADLIMPGLERGLTQRLTFQRRPRLVVAELGARAGVVGAGLVGWQAQGERS